MIRTFRLMNSNQQELSLNTDFIFGYHPKGLGVSLNNDFSNLETTRIFQKSELNLGQFSISLLLLPNDHASSYRRFFEVGEFLNFPPFTLIYKAPGIEEVHRDCHLSSFEKSERKGAGWLDEEIVFDFIGPWYRWESLEKNLRGHQIGAGKVYGKSSREYTYDDRSEHSRSLFLIENNSRYFGMKEHSALEIRIEATDEDVVNPSWYIEKDGEIVQDDGYRVTLKKGDALIVSSDVHSRKAEVVQWNGVVRNVYYQQDMSRTNFVTAPVGQSLLVFNVALARISYKLKKEWVLV